MNVLRNGWRNERMNPHSNAHMYTETSETNIWIWLIIIIEIGLTFKGLCCTPFFQSLLGVCISHEKLLVFNLMLFGVWLPNETFLLVFEYYFSVFGYHIKQSFSRVIDHFSVFVD